jgi:hypothetical protein
MKEGHTGSVATVAFSPDSHYWPLHQTIRPNTGHAAYQFWVLSVKAIEPSTDKTKVARVMRGVNLMKHDSGNTSSNMDPYFEVRR